MSSFVIDKKNGQFKLNITLARMIYRFLNKSEQQEVELYLEKNPKDDIAQAITVLYGLLSQRRRTNERLVKAVKEYRKKNGRYHLAVVDIPTNALYIEVGFNDDGSEFVKFYSKPNNKAGYEPLSLWINNVTTISEVEETKNDISENEALEIKSETKFNLWKSIKKWFRQFKRWLFYRKKNNRFREKKSQTNVFKNKGKK